MTINSLLENKQYDKLYVLSRYLYRVGEDGLSDDTYDLLESLLRAKADQFPDIQPYLDRTYDDDPIPYDLLNEFGIEPVSFLNKVTRSSLSDYLAEEKSNSIHSEVSYEAAYDYFKFLYDHKLDFMSSVKIDGVNTKMLYENGKFALALSRGRGDGASIDYTDGCAKVVPHCISTNSQYLKVTGESYVESDKLADLRKLYDEGKYKTEKSSARSMLCVTHRKEHYKWLHTRVFMAEGLATTLDQMFTKLEDAGFETVPHILFSWKNIPTEFEVFKEWLKTDIMDALWELGLGIPSDGVVIEVNDLTYSGEQHNQYNTRQLALKFEYWKYRVSKGVISDITIEQRRVFKSVRIKIDPITTYDGCKAEVINSFNPSILINNELYVGKSVVFERNSGAVNILVHGKRLEGILAEEESSE